MTRLTINGSTAGYENILTPAAENFLAELAERFSQRREQLLTARQEAQERFDSGELPGFLTETADIRHSDWQVAEAPAILQDRRVEITAPAERKKTIQALNSAAKVYMADFEDSLSPTWDNLLSGQQALLGASRGQLTMSDTVRGKEYRLDPDHACQLFVRPRGWHLPEKHIHHAGAPMSASLVDFGLFFFHNAKILVQRGRGPFLYLPKIQHWQEAALWEEVIGFAEAELSIAAGTTKVTLLIETLPAVFQMHEILHAMKNRLIGLNCGRWDYIFSYIKTLRRYGDRVVPERSQMGMDRPLLKAYSLELIKTCHRRNAHAMGGMSASIPIRTNQAANEMALQKVREDKQREVDSGHDGTWVAHPDLIKPVTDIFDQTMPAAHQKSRQLDTIQQEATLLEVPSGHVTAAGFDSSIQVALQYLRAWLSGSGAVPIFNLMEDSATAEIVRTQLWQWLHYPTRLQGGSEVTLSLFTDRLQVAKSTIAQALAGETAHLDTAVNLLEEVVQAPLPEDFLILRAYSYL